MATYTLRIVQNGKSKSGTFTDNQRAQLPADPNTEYRIYDENGNLITHPVVERQGDDLLVYANKVKDGTPELILTDYFNKSPVLNADYVADAGNTLMTNDKLAAIVPVMASEVLVKAITVGAALVIGGVILSMFDDDDSKGGINSTNTNENATVTDLATPTITIAPIATITNKNGSTTLTGTMNLNNENVDNTVVTLTVNGKEYPATPSTDNKSWTAEVPNAELAQTEGNNPIVANITITKNDVSKTANNAENTDTPVSDTENITAFTVDTTVGTPKITITDVPNIVKGQDTDSQIYTLSGTLDNIDADATPTVTVKINDTVITQTVNVAADKKTWSVDVEGKLLAEKLGDNQTVVASVIVVDTNGNTATAQTPADLYNVSAPAQTLNTPYITVTPLPEINNTNGSTPVSGTLDLNNENLDKATVTVSINGGAPVEAKISDDKKSWTVDVDNTTLIGDKNAPHNIVATVDIAKGEQAAQSTNTDNDRDTDPAVNNGSFTVDNTISTPEITINDVPNIEKGKQNDTYPISGSLKNIDADATPTVIVTVNDKPHTATVSADKKTWSVNVSGRDLAAKVGDNQKVTATVSVEDKMGNKATAAQAAEDAYNVTEPTSVTPTPVTPPTPAALNEPYITVTPLAEINDKNGKTKLQGLLDLKNEGVSETVTVSINGGEPITVPAANISADKKSWFLEVDNATLIGDKDAPHTVLATVTVSKDGHQPESANNSTSEDNPQINTVDFTVDTAISTPEITINDVPNMEQGKQNDTYPISGSLNNIDADATPTVTVSVNGTAITTPVTISADKKTWSVNVSGRDLAKTVGDNQKVTATVSVQDEVGNTAEAATPAEDSYNVTAAAPAEPKITFDTLGHDVFSGRSETKTISGKATGLPNNAKIEVTVAGKVYDVSLSGDTWSITIPASDLQEKGEKEVVASIKVANDVVASSDKGSFFVMTPSIVITSAPPSINSSNLSNKTIISGTYDADGVDRKVISINIGQMMDMEFPNGLILQVYDNSSTVTTYKTTDANNVIKLDEANKTWSIELDNSVLAHQVGSPETLAVQAYIEAYENYPNASEPVSRSNGNAQGYTSEVVAPQSSPYIISDLVDTSSHNLAIISSVIDVSADDDHSVSGSNGIQDTFVFSKVLDGSIAQIANFNADEDKLQLNSEVFTALSNTMSDFADYVQYNAATGALSYDADGAGAGAATQLAQLSKDLEIDQSNFIIA